MKKFTFIVASVMMLFIIPSCQKTSKEMLKLQEDLKRNVEETSPFEQVDYKLTKIEIIDTIRIADTLSHVVSRLEQVWQEPNLDDFKKYRDFDFDIRSNPKQYEYDVMEGQYKDASPYCAELRVNTLIRDSILAHWDMVKKYDYEYMHQTWLGLQRLFGFTYNNSGEAYYAATQVVDQMPQIKELSEFYNEYKARNQEEIFGYRILHDYTEYNPLMNGRIKVSEIVIVDPEYNILSIEE